MQMCALCDLQVVDAATQSVHGFTATAPHPVKIAWVPARSGNPSLASASVTAPAPAPLAG